MEVMSGFLVGRELLVRSASRTPFLFVVWTGIGLFGCCGRTEHRDHMLQFSHGHIHIREKQKKKKKTTTIKQILNSKRHPSYQFQDDKVLDQHKIVTNSPG